MNVRLLGTVRFEDVIALQERLINNHHASPGARIEALLCEHPRIITIGRRGSRGHIRLSNAELTSRQCKMKWEARGGGCVLHGPGQLAIYVIAPLAPFHSSVGGFMRRLHHALLSGINRLGFMGQSRPGSFGVWGRTGQLSVCGVSVKHGVTGHGCHLNVNPNMDLMKQVDVVEPVCGQPFRETTMSCLLSEHGRLVKMSTVRSVMVEELASAFGCSDYFLHTGHPSLKQHREHRDSVFSAT